MIFFVSMSAEFPILLGVNIDHSATLREARYRGYERSSGQMIEPDPVFLALLAERAGADGITVHLREDRRHMQERDLWRLKECLQTRLNLETACSEEGIRFALEVKPVTICIVPENRTEVTTEGGLNVEAKRTFLKRQVERAHAAGTYVSLFIDPDPRQIEAAVSTGALMVELHTGAFANAYYEETQRRVELNRLFEGALLAHKCGLMVNAGHGINYVNIATLCHIPHLRECNIGHSILSRAMGTGIEEAVREMKKKIRNNER